MQNKAIGPVPAVSGDTRQSEPVPDSPFKVNRNSPHQKALAALVGWDRLEQIAKIDAQEPDLQRSPFQKGGVEVKPR